MEIRFLILANVQKKKKKKKPICESNDKHREYQKDKHQDIKRDIEIIKYEEGE